MIRWRKQLSDWKVLTAALETTPELDDDDDNDDVNVRFDVIILSL